jgi:immunoglobulin-binding protein 1
VQKRRRQVSTIDESQNDFDLISLLLPSSSQGYSTESEDANDTEEILREATLLYLRLAYAQAHSQLESTNQELELLRAAPPPPPPQSSDDDPRKKSQDSEDIWKLDVHTKFSQGPLLDDTGRVSAGQASLSLGANALLRSPFVLLPFSLREWRIVPDSKPKYLVPDTIYPQCRWMSTLKLSVRGGNSSLVEG